MELDRTANINNVDAGIKNKWNWNHKVEARISQQKKASQDFLNFTV